MCLKNRLEEGFSFIYKGVLQECSGKGSCKRVSPDCCATVPYKSVNLQQSLARAADKSCWQEMRKSVFQGCPTKVSCKSVLQECSVRASTRVSSKEFSINVPKEGQGRTSACPAKQSYKSLVKTRWFARVIYSTILSYKRLSCVTSKSALDSPEESSTTTLSSYKSVLQEHLGRTSHRILHKFIQECRRTGVSYKSSSCSSTCRVPHTSVSHQCPTRVFYVTVAQECSRSFYKITSQEWRAIVLSRSLGVPYTSVRQNPHERNPLPRITKTV